MAVCVAIIGKDVSNPHEHPLDTQRVKPCENIPFSRGDVLTFPGVRCCQGSTVANRCFQNSPKYVTCLNPDEELSFQYRALSALDFVEEKLSKGGSDLRELYLGMLYSLETHKM